MTTAKKAAKKPTSAPQPPRAYSPCARCGKATKKIGAQLVLETPEGHKAVCRASRCGNKYCLALVSIDQILAPGLVTPEELAELCRASRSDIFSQAQLDAARAKLDGIRARSAT